MTDSMQSRDVEFAQVVGAESERGIGIVPVARTVSNIPQATIARQTNQVVPRQNNRNQQQQQQQGQTGNNSDGDGDGAGVWCCFIMVAIIVVVSVNVDGADSGSSRSSPTPFPSILPTAFPTTRSPTTGPTSLSSFCPAVFTGGVREDLVSCGTGGCSGVVGWCGLNDTDSIQMEVELRGDYDSGSEFITIVIDGEDIIGSTGTQCSAIFVSIATRTVSPVGGNLTLEYQNSPAVSPFCSGSQWICGLR